MAMKPIPEGYHSVTPYLIATGAGRLLDFLKQAFDAKEKERMAGPDGRIVHAEVSIGDSIVMLGEARAEYPAMPSCLFLYVTDVDARYRRALDAGATSVSEPADQIWGDRAARIKDPLGNLWMVATHVEDVAPEEIQRRAQAAMAQRRSGSGA